jgi:hypothetical protein
MVPIGPKKGGGIIKVPLFTGGYTKTKLFEDKSGSLPVENNLLNKDVRVWRTEPSSNIAHSGSGSCTNRNNDTPMMHENPLAQRKLSLN